MAVREVDMSFAGSQIWKCAAGHSRYEIISCPQIDRTDRFRAVDRKLAVPARTTTNPHPKTRGVRHGRHHQQHRFPLLPGRRPPFLLLVVQAQVQQQPREEAAGDNSMPLPAFAVRNDRW